jgi:M6 family metalloprotease-like protein
MGPVGSLVLVLILLCARITHAQHVEDLETLRSLLGLRAAPAVERAVGFSDEGWALRAERSAVTGDPITGVLTVLLVPALFSDSEDPQAPEGHLQQLFFEGPSASGTLREFFEEASSSRLSAAGAVAPWYRTSVTLEGGTGGDTSVFGTGPDFSAYLLEAIAAADQELDFGRFDNDGPDGIPNSGDDNGTVDALTFLFTESARSCGGSGVWPHKSGLAPRNGGVPYESNDLRPAGTRILADGYVIISASECDGAPLSTIAVVAHELGHELRLPDLYHPIGEGLESILSVNRRWVLGCFDLMAGGSWGCGPADEFPSFGPTHFSPYMRNRLGWINLREVGDVRHGEFVLQPVQSSQQVLQVPLDASGVESLFIEYRPAVGFDVDLPGSGILIYHYNQGGVLRPNPPETSPFYLVNLIEADGNSTLVRTHLEGGNRGEAADIFVVDGSVPIISNLSYPATRLADGTATAVTIHSIETSGNGVRLVISTAESPGVVARGGLEDVTALESVSIDLPIGGGVLPYGVAAGHNTLPRGLELEIAADRLLVEGTPFQTGEFGLDIQIRDDRGVTGTTVLTLRVRSVIIPDSTLMSGLLPFPTSVLTDDQRLLLDTDGNGNGEYDVGDLRRYLLEGG